MECARSGRTSHLHPHKQLLRLALRPRVVRVRAVRIFLRPLRVTRELGLHETAADPEEGGHGEGDGVHRRPACLELAPRRRGLCSWGYPIDVFQSFSQSLDRRA